MTLPFPAMSVRLNVIPEFSSAGLSFIETLSPECKAMPTHLIEVFKVRCRMFLKACSPPPGIFMSLNEWENAPSSVSPETPVLNDRLPVFPRCLLYQGGVQASNQRMLPNVTKIEPFQRVPDSGQFNPLGRAGRIGGTWEGSGRTSPLARPPGCGLDVETGVTCVAPSSFKGVGSA